MTNKNYDKKEAMSLYLAFRYLPKKDFGIL